MCAQESHISVVVVLPIQKKYEEVGQVKFESKKMPISFCLPEMYNLQVHEASSNKLFTEIAPF